MSPNKKLVAYHIARLKDRNVDVRLSSIRELAELNDPDALDSLQETFRTDPDMDVRKAAQEAGRAIYVRQRQQPS
ncbi:MAG: HEAT repeat domain-containing protein [Anaerolineae bacterium]|nr:HEAT repeat domain-containing protein [Anaerolineae bacterium]